MKVIQFPESDRVKRSREILELVEAKTEEVQKLSEEITLLTIEWAELDLEMAPYEYGKILPYRQLELEF